MDMEATARKKFEDFVQEISRVPLNEIYKSASVKRKPGGVYRHLVTSNEKGILVVTKNSEIHRFVGKQQGSDGFALLSDIQQRCLESPICQTEIENSGQVWVATLSQGQGGLQILHIS